MFTIYFTTGARSLRGLPCYQEEWWILICVGIPPKQFEGVWIIVSLQTKFYVFETFHFCLFHPCSFLSFLFRVDLIATSLAFSHFQILKLLWRTSTPSQNKKYSEPSNSNSKQSYHWESRLPLNYPLDNLLVRWFCTKCNKGLSRFR